MSENRQAARDALDRAGAWLVVTVESGGDTFDVTRARDTDADHWDSQKEEAAAALATIKTAGESIDEFTDSVSGVLDDE